MRYCLLAEEIDMDEMSLFLEVVRARGGLT